MAYLNKIVGQKKLTDPQILSRKPICTNESEQYKCTHNVTCQ